jgi:deoxynucleoside triphosphate triphosphohydrolase SAMHD1
LHHYGLSEVDHLFIEEIISGTPEKKRKARTAEKFYLYDIVNNTRSGLDVDKLDYYQRDMRSANVVLSANFDRLLTLGRAMPAIAIDQPASIRGSGGGSGSAWSLSKFKETHAPDRSKLPVMVCYPEKTVREALDFFQIRFRMHQTVYTHKSVKQVEFMITDALAKADPFIRIRGRPTENFPTGEYKMSECIFDMTAFTNLNDSIIDVIKFLPMPELDEAKAILRRVDMRDLYICLGRSAFASNDKAMTMSEEEIANEIVEIANAKEVAVDDDADGLLSADDYLYDITEQDTMPGFPRAGSFSQPRYNAPAASSVSGGSVVGANGALAMSLESEDIIVEKMHVHYGEPNIYVRRINNFSLLF